MSALTDSEIIVNLWYVYDDLGVIYSLRGRCYVGSGSDEEKLALLRRFAATDYLIAKPFSVPERLHTIVNADDGIRRLPIVTPEAFELMNNPVALFEELFVELEKELPAQTRLSIGSAPLICITPLLANEDGNLKPIISPTRRLRICRHPRARGNNRRCDVADGVRSRLGPRSISTATSAQGGKLLLEDDSTFRLCPCAGDYLLRVRCTDPWSNRPEFAISDFWEFREGDRLLITNRQDDYPAPVEHMEEGGPSLWKALPGDRLAWVGWRMQSNERKPTLVALINCQHEGYVYGEPASPSLSLA